VRRFPPLAGGQNPISAQPRLLSTAITAKLALPASEPDVVRVRRHHLQRTLGPFTVAQALDAGLTRDFLEGPYVRRLFTGVYVPADAHITDQVLVSGALMVLPADTLVTGITALRQLGVHVGTALPLQFVSTHPHQIRRSNLQVSRVNRLPLARGRCVIPEHALMSAVKRLDLIDLVTAGD
jgi:hypothetical protein